MVVEMVEKFWSLMGSWWRNEKEEDGGGDVVVVVVVEMKEEMEEEEVVEFVVKMVEKWWRNGWPWEQGGCHLSLLFVACCKQGRRRNEL